MIRNILYSLFVHSVLILLIYFSFNSTPPKIEIDKTLKVAVSFVAQVGNSSDKSVMPQQPLMPAVPNEMPKPLLPEIKPKQISPIQKENPKPKKSKPKSPVKKPETAKKTQSKQEAKKSKPKEADAKTDTSKTKVPNKKDDAKQDPEKPKFEEKKPEIKEEIKKDKPKVVEPEKEKLEKEKPISETDLETEDEDAQDEEESPESQYSFTENSIESLDLLVREKFNIQTQIKRCYKKALQENGEDSMLINAHIFIAQDGFIDLDVVVFKIPPEKVKNGVEDEDFVKAKETVKKALKFCSPLRNLPQDKYDIWKEIDLQFD
jgi:hypothetical protein